MKKRSSTNSKILLLSHDESLCKKLADILGAENILGITPSVDDFLTLLNESTQQTVIVDAEIEKKCTPGVLPLLLRDHPSIGRILVERNHDDATLPPLAHYQFSTDASSDEIRAIVSKALDWHFLFEKHQQLVTLLANPSRETERRMGHNPAEALRRSNVQLRRLAMTDPLTGIGNRRLFTQQMQWELSRAKRDQRTLSTLFIDVDFFKQFNDRYGHSTGDLMLQELSACLVGSVRQVDIVTRYGGEEFVIILPDTSKEHALLLADRIRRRVSRFPFGQHLGIPTGTLTISIGVASFPQDGSGAHELITHADKALFSAKRRGRNLVLGAPTQEI